MRRLGDASRLLWFAAAVGAIGIAGASRASPRISMDPARVQALRDTKALYDEGILTEAEFQAKKAELLAAKP